ncbi:MAG TPA: D-alanine--D-alanine ligase [Mycobacteriales bacterium]|jgi:D-alanine-D-alanine ligase|nr:D-alanine--D-alanine ligase [Mycobacteriales bacterium]
MSDLGRVVVLAGGLTYERDVSLRSGRRVVDALKSAGAEAILADTDPALLPLLAELAPAASFIALHGGSGEDGAIRGVLDCAGVPYVGAGANACRLAFDKPVAKELIRRAGLATPDWVAVPHTTFRELGASAVLDRIIERLGLPLMVKPAQGGSALGASAVFEAAQLPGAMVGCFSYGEIALVEQFVVGTEIAVSVLELDAGDPQALPAVEIAATGGAYDYGARYTAGETDFHVPARVSDEITAAAAELALAAHRVLGLRDLSRTDAIVDATGTVQFLEVNVAPGMTETSLLPMAAAAAQLQLGIVCRDLLAAAAARGPG